jgi:hypothetical protein
MGFIMYVSPFAFFLMQVGDVVSAVLATLTADNTNVSQTADEITKELQFAQA